VTPSSEEFRETFGSDSGFEGCDFRPHFEGFLWNAFRISVPSATRETHIALVWAQVREMAGWILLRRDRFQPGDRFQFIVAWPETMRAASRQIVKVGGGFEDLAGIAAADGIATCEAASQPPGFLLGWDKGIYE
jgi:hypothetical protein